ncbi:energy transducer TonB [Mucilaginibacter sp.]
MNYRQQENNYPKAFLATSVILGLVMALSYFLVFKAPVKEQEGTGGILVNYGTVDEGMGDDYMSTEEPSVAENANHSKPDKVTPTPPTEQPAQTERSEKNVVTQNTEDAPEVAATSKKPSQTIATNTPTKPVQAKPAVNQNALYKGKTNNGTGEGDGTGNKPGNQGDPNGSTLTPDYGKGGGGGDGSSVSLPNRTNVYKPTLTVDRSVQGIVVVDIIVYKDGSVSYAQAGRGTTVSSASIIQKCEDAAKKLRFSASENAPDQQRGKMVFRFKTQ